MFALAAVLVIAAGTRFAWLDLMEFKGDEAAACRLGLHVLGFSEPGVGRFFPTAGLTSSIGVPNPPLFVYLLAVPLAIVRSPIAAAAFVAATNVVAVWLVYVLGKRCQSRRVGVCAAALLALSPWGIVFSRKIWAQDLLPICTTLFALQLHALLVERRGQAAFWLLVIAATATQLHFSAWILVGVLAAALVVSRRWVNRSGLAAGFGVAVVLYLPFLVYHAGETYRSIAHAHRYVGPGIVGRFEHVFGLMLSIAGGFCWGVSRPTRPCSPTRSALPRWWVSRSRLGVGP